MDSAPHNAGILLEWYAAMGAGEAIDEVPAGWFADLPALKLAPPAAAQPSAPQPAAPPRERKALTRLNDAPLPVPQVPAASGADVMAARELARGAGDLAQLRTLLESFDGCGLKKTASRLCLSRGSPQARLMLIGEAPGKDEDARGQPFVGRAGQLLDRMLAAIGLGETDVYITNLVFWRPPGNRTPSPEEVQVCQPFVERQIELLAPDLLIFLGNAAAKQLTGATEGIMKLRGRWLNHGGIRAMATLHPAYLLRNPIAKRLAWRDLLAIREALDACAAGEGLRGGG
jgi:uracil-DNA glycosylase family 4